jgi:hypothetical protein
LDINCDIPLPVNLNCWKHHAGFVKDQITSTSNEKFSDSELRKILLIIGESQMDIYIGEYTPVQIVNEVTKLLSEEGKFNFAEYKMWLNEDGEDYKLLTISDKSIWTFRLGNERERYIHTHPGRYSPSTIRVKSSTLKTFILSEIFSLDKKEQDDELSLINRIRKEYLELPPLKSVLSASGFLRLKNVFNSVSM